jgi:hypothetical protein
MWILAHANTEPIGGTEFEHRSLTDSGVQTLKALGWLTAILFAPVASPASLAMPGDA